MTSYHDRQAATYLDGTPVFITAQDRQVEAEVAAVLEKAWGCELRSFGPLCPVDCYAIRGGRLVGLAEIKSRSHASTAYETVFLNMRKWLALTLGSVAVGVPALFAVRFTDGVFWVPVADVDARSVTVGGRRDRAGVSNDIEPVILVPVAIMRKVPLSCLSAVRPAGASPPAWLPLSTEGEPSCP